MFEQMTALLLEAATAPPEARRQIVTRMDRDLLAGDGCLVETYLQSERAWAGLAVMKEMLPPEARLRVLRGQDRRVRFPVEQLSERGRSFVRSVWKASEAKRVPRDGTEIPVPEPRWLQFDACRLGKEPVGPVLWIYLEDLGAYAYAGGVPLETALRKRIAALWKLPGDADTDTACDRTVPAPATSPEPAWISDPEMKVTRRLEELARTAPLSVMARLPDEQPADPGVPYGRTVRVFLAALNDYLPYCQSKWRGNVLLVDYPAWFHETWPIGTWKTVSRFRQVEAGGGFVPLAEWVGAARQFPAATLRRLEREFPVLAHFADLHGFFTTACRAPGSLAHLTSEAGLPLTDELAAILMADPFLKPPLEQMPVRAVRLLAEERTDEKGPARVFTLGYVTPDGRWVPVRGFVYRPGALGKKHSRTNHRPQ